LEDERRDRVVHGKQRQENREGIGGGRSEKEWTPPVPTYNRGKVREELLL
jgi:hypothetical protein